MGVVLIKINKYITVYISGKILNQRNGSVPVSVEKVSVGYVHTLFKVTFPIQVEVLCREIPVEDSIQETLLSVHQATLHRLICGSTIFS